MVCLDIGSDEWTLKVVGKTLQVGETKNECQTRVEKARKETCQENRFQGTFMRAVSEVAVA